MVVLTIEVVEIWELRCDMRTIIHDKKGLVNGVRKNSWTEI